MKLKNTLTLETISCLAFIGLGLSSSTHVLAQSNNYSAKSHTQQHQLSQLSNVITESYRSAFGLTPTQEELYYWIGRSGQQAINMNVLMTNHRGWLQSGNEINETIVRSYQAILSRSPNRDEINYWQSRIYAEGLVYTDLTRAHQDWKNRGGR